VVVAAVGALRGGLRRRREVEHVQGAGRKRKGLILDTQIVFEASAFVSG
jgi:hypothetical protein